MKQELSRFIFVVGLLCSLADVSRAWECGTDYHHPITEGEVKHATRRYTAVFAGTVESIRVVKRRVGPTTFGNVNEVTFRVSRWWQGGLQSVVVVSTKVSTDDCGFLFIVGKKYLVYGSGFGTDCCTPTKPLSEAKADLAILGPGYSPVKLSRLLTITGAMLLLAVGVFCWRRQRTRLSVSV